MFTCLKITSKPADLKPNRQSVLYINWYNRYTIRKTPGVFVKTELRSNRMSWVNIIYNSFSSIQCALFYLLLFVQDGKIESKQKYITWSILGDRHRSPSLVSLKAVVRFGDLGALWYGSALPYISAVLMFRRTHFCIKSTITIPLSRP